MSVKKRLCLQLRRREINWTCHCLRRGTIPGQESGEVTSRLGGAAGGLGKQILLQRRATGGEEGRPPTPGSPSRREEDVVVGLINVVVAEGAAVEEATWTGTWKGPMLTSWFRRRQMARTRLLRRSRWPTSSARRKACQNWTRLRRQLQRSRGREGDVTTGKMEPEVKEEEEGEVVVRCLHQGQFQFHHR